VSLAFIIALMMAAASTSETSVNFYKTTWHNNKKISHFSVMILLQTVVKIGRLVA
jgi:hypothetical protein